MPTQNTPPPAPSTPNYEGDCVQDVGQEAVEAWDNTFDMVNDDGEFKTQLEQWDTLWGNAGDDYVCVGAQLSAPDPSHNNGEYLSSVTSIAPDFDPGGCTLAIRMEVWGNGFYRSTDCSDPTEWHPNIWLKNGSWVCAARSDAADTVGANSNAGFVAAVKDGQAEMGAADPYRAVTCIVVK